MLFIELELSADFQFLCCRETRVFIRVRPQLAHEANKPSINIHFPDEASLEIIAPGLYIYFFCFIRNCCRLILFIVFVLLLFAEKGTNKKKKTSYSYDKVFGSSSTQLDIYQEISALVQVNDTRKML